MYVAKKIKAIFMKSLIKKERIKIEKKENVFRYFSRLILKHFKTAVAFKRRVSQLCRFWVV